ncbi:MAG: hypothetical protein AVDCRST_MAG32-2119 [uncultured Nocardioides sp.]|uniref:Peptidase metallopeptidase domain-containing protein n=1 Tax=uncultured Nocardioides sp. TaxID=198441 RepID=A0A6J4NGX0_9ACTN|nr:MAG: hypothetical protein AVDCRST_MAG32-2119 [uncultured Nocardioides sp.]
MRRLPALMALLVTVALLAMTTPADAAPRKWPKGPITYADRSKDPEAVRLAVQAWNRSGLRIRFKQVRNPRRADVVIRNTKRVPAGCGTGYGTLGYPGPGRQAFVSILHGTDAGGQGCALPGQTRVVAHELGHVLGLEHYMKSCSLMNTSHVNGVAGSQCIDRNDINAAKPGRWRCRLLEGVDLRAARRLYGGRPRLSQPEWCDAVDRIPATGAVSVDPVAQTVTVTRAAEPALPGWLGPWGWGEPGFEVHATPSTCTAVPGDDATQVGVGLWGATPVGGSLTEYVFGLPPGLQCITVWQFDRGTNFSLLPTSVMVEVPAGQQSRARTGTAGLRRADEPARWDAPVRVLQLD